MNSLEIRRLKNLKIKKSNLDLGIRYYQVVSEQINEIFNAYMKIKGIEGKITDIKIDKSTISVDYQFFNDDEYQTENLSFPKIFLTLNADDIFEKISKVYE